MKSFLSFACTLLLFTSSARGEQTAAILNPGVTEGIWNSDGPFTLGFAFRVNKPIRITAVGVFDSFDDGLINPHDLALWTITGTEIFSATVPAGTASELVDRFRYLPIEGLILAPDFDYIIAAANFGMHTDHYLATSPVDQSSHRITLFSSRSIYTASGALAFPTRIEPHSTPAWFGANFRFVAVPEPSSFTLFALAMLGIGFRRRR